MYSKDDGDGDTYSMIPPTEDVISSYSVDVTKKDNSKTVHIGDYSKLRNSAKPFLMQLKMSSSHKKRTPFRNNNFTADYPGRSKSENYPGCGKIREEEFEQSIFSPHAGEVAKNFRYSTAGRKSKSKTDRLSSGAGTGGSRS